MVDFFLKRKRHILLYGCSQLLFFAGFLSAQPIDTLEQVTFYHENGDIASEGTLRNGVPDGYWKAYHVNGNIKSEGNRKNEELDSLWKFYDLQGKLYVSITYKNGIKDGPRTTFSEDIKKKIELFADGKRQGRTAHFYPDGSVERTIPFENDKEQGMGYGYDEDGLVNTLYTYKSGVLTKKRTINRKDDESRKQGIWMSFHANMRIKEEGNYIDDLRHGFFKYYTNTGNLIKTERWVMGVLQEPDATTEKIQIRKELDKSTGHISAVGPYLQGQKEGVHRIYDEEGNVVDGGIYAQGVLLAEGITDDMGRRQKHWKFYYQTGDLKEEGGYKDGRRHGKWTYYFINGNVEQQGRFSKDKPDGYWVWYHDNGEVWREEEYVRGLRDGAFVEKDDEGNVIAKGEFIEGFKEGPWVYEIGDIRQQGSYFDGERHGEWIHFFTASDNVRFKGEYINGMRESRHTWYYDNGQVEIRGKYVANKKNGVWEFYNKNGFRYLTITYENDEEIEYNGSKISYGKRYDKRLEEAEQ